MRNKPLLLMILIYVVLIAILPFLFIEIFKILNVNISTSDMAGQLKFKLTVYALGGIVFLINLTELFVLKLQSVYSKMLMSLLFSVLGLMSGIFFRIYLIKGTETASVFLSVNDLNLYTYGIIGGAIGALLFGIISKMIK